MDGRFHGKSQSKVDDDWGYTHLWKPPRMFEKSLFQPWFLNVLIRGGFRYNVGSIPRCSSTSLRNWRKKTYLSTSAIFSRRSSSDSRDGLPTVRSQMFLTIENSRSLQRMPLIPSSSPHSLELSTVASILRQLVAPVIQSQ